MVQRRIRLVIGYDGTDFCGWQRQKHDRSIQGEIERCLERMTGTDILLHGAGRTDAGVHADGMVAHFDTTARIPVTDFRRGLNAMLPCAIRIFEAAEAEGDFHARFAATGKEYAYTIYHGEVQPPRLRLYSLHVTATLDLDSIRRCLRHLLGTHDFSSFENSGSRDKDNGEGRGAVRTIRAARLEIRSPEVIEFIFTGDGFLRNMVRNMVGTLLAVGRGKISSDEFAEILAARDRKAGGATAPAHGLRLVRVFYSP